jgi:CheY-like chemotaxis protein
MRVLLIDDKPKQRRAGTKQLQADGHEVVAMSEYGEAKELAEKESFDVALIDLLMPAEATTLGTEGLKFFGQEMGIGFPLALALAHTNVGGVAVVTDTNHHNHPMSAMVDWFHRKTLNVNGKKVLILHAQLDADGNKDWSAALRNLEEAS